MSFRRTTIVFAYWLGLSGSVAHAAGPVASPPGVQPPDVQPPVVQPPEVLEQVDAVMPPSWNPKGVPPAVVLAVVVQTDGSVGAVEVVQSGGEDFDQAAMAAVRRWRFRPAQQDGEPKAARIRVRIDFAPPVPESAPAIPVGPADAKASAPEPKDESATPQDPVAERPAAPARAEVAPEATIDVTVRGRKAEPPRAASDFVIDRDVLQAAPRRDAGQMLQAAPGIYVGRSEGEGVAQEVLLRGFDAGHGQDIEFRVGDVPLNHLSHIHGQGYADLSMIMPEVVRSLRVIEGVYDPRQGDFAVAGSATYDLGVADRGVHTYTQGGSFATFRQAVVWAPLQQDEATFGAFAIRRSAGFGSNRGSVSGTGIGQFAGRLGPRTEGLVHVAAHGVRANIAGVVRRDDVEAGDVDFHGTYDDPSATAQSALSSRVQLAGRIEHRTPRSGRTSLGVWLARSDFRSRENFTGYRQRAMIHPEWVGRGDLVEQENHDSGMGARMSHRTGPWSPHREISAWHELGLDVRGHWIEQAQRLLEVPQNEVWDERVDARLRVADIGAYFDTNWELTRFLRIRGGVRADVLHYDVADDLGNYTVRDDIIVGRRRTALGVAWGPRATAEVQPVRGFQIFTSYGEGYRSPQARQLEEGENAPFTKVRGIDGGVRWFERRRRVEATVAGYGTWLSDDLAFDPEDNRLERIGPTRRAGVVAHAVIRPWRFLLASLSVTWVDAVLRAPPPATVDNPVPAFETGQALPYVPPVVARADVQVRGALFRAGGHPFIGSLGVGFQILSARPLPYGQASDPLYLLDLAAGLRWRWLEAGVEVFNALDLDYAANEYVFVSAWPNRPVPSRVPARHIAAGPPLTALGSLTLHFGGGR